MKFAIFLALLSLNLTLNSAYANEEDTSLVDDIVAFCDEQAQLAGIEDSQEKAQYTKECRDSYGVQSGDTQ